MVEKSEKVFPVVSRHPLSLKSTNPDGVSHLNPEDRSFHFLNIFSPGSRTFLSLIVLLNILFLTVATIVYNEPFHFWDYALSFLVATKTVNGLSNHGSQYIYSFSMICSGFIMIALSVTFWGADGVRHPKPKAPHT